MKQTKYNIPVYEDEDIADLKEYSEKMAEVIKAQVDKFGSPLIFKGILETWEELQAITDAVNGEIYAVTQENKNYIWNGTTWEVYSNNLISQAGGGTIINSSNVDVATATLTEHQEFSTTEQWQYVKLNFSEINNNNFILEDGGIKIGKGITRILISGHITLSTAITGRGQIAVKKNGGTMGRVPIRYKNEDFYDISMVAQSFDVMEGDVITLCVGLENLIQNKLIRKDFTYMTIVAIHNKSEVGTNDIIVSPTEPQTDRRKVWFQRGKNLFNGQIVNGYGLNEDGTMYGTLSRAVTDFIPIVENCNYCFSGATFKMVCTYNKDKNFVSSLNGSLVNTFSAPSNATYVRLAFDNTVSYSNLQVEYGEEATEHEKYINPAIYVKNDNDKYEEFIKKNIVRNSKIESTEETYSCNYINSSTEIEQANNLLIIQNGYSFLDINIFRQGKHYFGNVVIKKNSGNFTNVQELVVKLAKPVKGVYNSGCFLTNNQYSVYDVGYFYIGGTDFYIADHKEKGYNYAKIHLDVVVN